MTRKPWGSEQIIFEAGQARVKLLRVKPGKRTSKQFHREKQEAMMLISGCAILSGEIMSPGVIHKININEAHRLVGVGTHEAVILEMAHGSDEDIVRLADDFGRATTTATQPARGQ